MMRFTPVFIGSVALLASGCETLQRTGRVGAGVASVVAPEYRASIENVLHMLQDEQLFTEVDFIAETPDGRRWPITDIKITARPVETSWPLAEVPPGVMRRIAKQPLPPEVEEQRNILADALRKIPSSEPEKED